MKRFLVVALMTFLCAYGGSSVATAQERAPGSADPPLLDAKAADDVWHFPSGGYSRVPWIHATRGAVLPMLYVSFIGLEAYDGYSTNRGLRQGAVESNALVGAIAQNQRAVWAVKGATAFISIYVAERLWRGHHRGEAIAVMFVSNSVMTAVAVTNASVLRTQQ